MSKNTWNTLKPTSAQIRDAHEQWIVQASLLATHALTLTFDGGKIKDYLENSPSIHAANDPRMIEKYKKSMHWFRIELSKRLYGRRNTRRCEKLLLIPVLEGLHSGKNPHYHCLLGVSATRFDDIRDIVLNCWDRAYFSGKHNTVDSIYDQGFSRYSSKDASDLMGFLGPADSWKNGHQGIA